MTQITKPQVIALILLPPVTRDLARVAASRGNYAVAGLFLQAAWARNQLALSMALTFPTAYAIYSRTDHKILPLAVTGVGVVATSVALKRFSFSANQLITYFATIKALKK